MSSDLLKSGPLVVNFYRGRWCPFCSATVVGVSPEVEHLPFSASRWRGPARSNAYWPAPDGTGGRPVRLPAS
ncbi:MAG: hypothetical protein WB677_11360 [Xanthobacteraceae bacterium]